MGPLVSVIVPVYNVEAYLRECIDSVTDQTYKNLEILIVDDGSTDNSPVLCEELLKSDTRIKVFHKKNGGLSDARNYALDRCHGEYITFIDSDDIVDKRLIEICLSKVNSSRSDMVSVNLQQFEVRNEIKIDDKFSFVTCDAQEAARKMLTCKGISSCGCAKLYRASLFKAIRFPVGRLYEDYLTIYRILSETSCVTIVDAQLYFYRQRPGSIMRYQCSKKTVTLVDASVEVTEYVVNRWPDLKIAAYEDQIAQCLKCLQGILNYDKAAFLDYQDKIDIIVRSKSRCLLVSRSVRIKNKIKILSYFLGKRFFIRIYNKFDGSRPI